MLETSEISQGSANASMPPWLIGLLIFAAAYLAFLYKLAPSRAEVDLVTAPAVVHSIASVSQAANSANSNASSAVRSNDNAPKSAVTEVAALSQNKNDVAAAEQSSEASAQQRQMLLAANMYSPDVTTRRTAVVSLASLPADQALPMLQAALVDTNEQVRLSAVYALRRLAIVNTQTADQTIISLSTLLSDADPAVVNAAQTALLVIRRHAEKQ